MMLRVLSFLTGDPEEDCKDTLIFGVMYLVLLVLFVWFVRFAADFLNGY